MGVAQEFLAEFDGEMPSTRKLLERVPSERGSWKPHPKSFSLGHLAQLVAGMPGWLVPMLRDDKLDIGAGPGDSLEKTEALIARFDRGVHDGHEALASASDRDLEVPWSLMHGNRVLFTMPLVSFDELAEPPFSRYRWGIRQSGAYLPETLADALEDLWEPRWRNARPKLRRR